MSAKVQGATQNLKPSQSKALARLHHRRYPVAGGYTAEQARELAALSHGIGRQIGLLLDRQGRPQMVIVGEPGSLFIPDLGRVRQGPGRLRGLRLLHTHLGSLLLSREDLMDMVFLRLDSLAVLTVDAEGEPETFQYAHLLPKNEAKDAYQVHAPTAWDRVDADFTALARALEDEFSRTEPAATAEPAGKPLGQVRAGLEPALLVSVSARPKADQERSLAELAELARTAGLYVAATMMQRVPKLNPRSILGKGKLAELETLALQSGARLLVFDCELSPSQMRTLAELTERTILDRTQLILDIFARHAVSRAGKLQVEMAQLGYTLPRLVGRGMALSRLAGGIGGRGPGETKLELDRRKIRARMTRIKRELDELRKRRSSARARRERAGLPIAALVGYTNAGKSTLLNILTNSKVLTEDKLFATLDPTSRRLRFPEERELILTDTVGFLRELPNELKEAFQATLEELDAADLLIHVADAGHPELEEQITAVEEILRERELHETPRILALNKWDKVSEEERVLLGRSHPEALPLSALTGQGLSALTKAIIARIDWKRALQKEQSHATHED